MTTRRLAATSMLAAALVAPNVAAADDGYAIMAGAIGFASAFGWDVAFTAYGARAVVSKEEPNFGWMVAQTCVTAPQMLIGQVPIVLGQTEDSPERTTDDDESALFALFIPLASFGTQMTTFSVWSLADKSVPVDARYGVSWMVGANLTFTTAMVTSLIAEPHYTRPWFSIPTVAIAGAETAGSAYQAVHDDEHRAAWIGMTVWSGTLAAHGTVSLLTYFAEGEHKGYDPYERRPPRYVPRAGVRDTRARATPLERWRRSAFSPILDSVAPTSLNSNALSAPGLAFTGRF